MTLLGNQVEIRLARESDLPFIYSSWSKGHVFGSGEISEEEAEREIRKRRRLIEYVIKSPKTATLVACLSTAPDVIVGYSVAEQKDEQAILHWVFVKKDWRKLGIARALVYPETTHVTHLTKLGRIIKPARWIYSPLG